MLISFYENKEFPNIKSLNQFVKTLARKEDANESENMEE